MGTRKYFPLGKEQGRMKKTTKRRFEKMKAKKWWKKDERKKRKIQRVTNTSVLCNEITKWSKWKIHKKKKRNKKSRMKKRRKEKQQRNRKKKKITRKNVQKKNILSNAEEEEKKGDTRIEYERNVKHNWISKTFSKIKSLFLKRHRKKWWDVSKTKVFWFKKLKKLEMQKSDQKSSKKRRNQEHLYPEGRKNGTRKDMCSKKNNEEIKLKKGKKKGRWKTDFFFKKKIKGEDKPEERNKKRIRWRKKRGL